MILEKSGIIFIVTEHNNKWTVKSTRGGLTVCYEIDKSICGNIGELGRYIEENDMF